MIKLKTLLPECEECGRDWNHGHDHEASMAGNELKDAISNASKIQMMIGDNDNLPGWVSSYITLASDYLHSVAEYMAGESEEMSQQPGPGFNMNEAKKPSAGLSKEKKSDIVKKAKAGKDIGKKGKGFEKIEKAAGGGEKGKKIAAAAMWKNAKR
jgi:hypothetical protein